MRTRRLRESDLTYIVAMSSEQGWTANDFYSQMQKRDVAGTVVVDEADNIPTAFVLYEFSGSSIEVICIHADDEDRDGVLLINAMKAGLSSKRWRYISVELHEDNLPGHLFLKSCGFKAIEITDNLFADGGAGYHFVYALLATTSRGVKEFYEERHGNR